MLPVKVSKILLEFRTCKEYNFRILCSHNHGWIVVIFTSKKKFGARRQSLEGDWGIGGQVNKVINKVYVSIN